jgi:hypothetical protein
MVYILVEWLFLERKHSKNPDPFKKNFNISFDNLKAYLEKQGKYYKAGNAG